MPFIKKNDLVVSKKVMGSGFLIPSYTLPFNVMPVNAYHKGRGLKAINNTLSVPMSGYNMSDILKTISSSFPMNNTLKSILPITAPFLMNMVGNKALNYVKDKIIEDIDVKKTKKNKSNKNTQGSGMNNKSKSVYSKKKLQSNNKNTRVYKKLLNTKTNDLVNQYKFSGKGLSMI